MIRSAGIAVLILVVAACSSARKDTRSTDARSTAQGPGVVKPWTTDFQKATLVVADEIVIEGPDGLLDHVATRAESESHTKSERTTSQGFLQEIVQKPNVAPVEIRGFLDHFELIAMKKLTVLERPGPVDVVLRANGDVFVREAASGAERRTSALRVEGKIQR